MIDSALRGELAGATDSERYFLAVRSALRGPGLDGAVAAVREVVGRLRDRCTYTSLNAMLPAPKGSWW
jgi:hypothetical protein